MNGKSIRPSEWIRQKRRKASIEEAAREIRKDLDNWYAEREIAKVKWIWELIQNARDVAKKQNKECLEVSFVLDRNQLIFEHNAGPFSLDDIYALVNGRSSKSLGASDIIGEFGKGFIVTHIVSGKVGVKGWLKDDSIRVDKTFDITLDRSIQTSDELTVTHIADNIEECGRQLDTPAPSLKYDTTRFEYPLGDEGRDAAVTGLNALGDSLPFVLAFTEPEMKVKIVKEGKISVYSVAKTETLQPQPIRIELLKMAHRNRCQGDGLLVVSSISSGVNIAVPCRSSDRAILELGRVSRLFKTYPLAKTYELVLPVAIDAPFRVSAERFDLQYRDDQIAELNSILQAAIHLLKELCRWALDNNIQNKELLFKIKAPPEGGPCREQWFQALSNLVGDISRLKAVEAIIDAVTDKTEFQKPESVYFPSPLVGSDLFNNQKFILGIWNLSRLFGLKVPAKNLIMEWSDIRNCWGSLGITVGNEQTFEKIVKQTEELQSFDSLKKKITKDERALAFLEYLYKLCDFYRTEREQVPEFLKMAIYCNQKGIFKEPDKLNIDQNVPDQLKDISEKLFESLRQSLLNKRFSKDSKLKQHFQALGLNLIDENSAICLLYDSIHRNWKLKIKSMETDADEYKRGVMDFEKWLLQNRNVVPLLEKKCPLSELPFLCEDSTLRVAEKEFFVLPDAFLETDAREHTKIWPPDTKLSKGYSRDITNATLIKNRLVASNICRSGLLISENTDLSEDQIKEMSREKIRIKHSPPYTSATYKASTTVSRVIAFNRVLEFAEQSRNPELTKGILVFVLSYLVPRDKAWYESKSVRASEMGQNMYGRTKEIGRSRDFEIFPCLWLAQMKRNKWVATSFEDEKGHRFFEPNEPSVDNLVDYLKSLKPSILGNERVQIFLQQKFEFSPLEMTGWLLTGGESDAEQALIDGLKRIYELADSRKIDPVHLLNEMLVEKQIRNQYDGRNTNFGLIMERTVRKVFEQLKFGEYGFEVIPRWKGYDFDAILSKQSEESDYGILGIEVKSAKTEAIIARFEVEVKATRADAVRMTLTQANSAVDHSDIYLLCVVDAKGLSKDFDNLHSVSLSDEQIGKLAEKILPWMNIVSIGEDLRQIIMAFRKVGAATGDIRVDYSARFTIPLKLWKAKGMTINKWFLFVLNKLGVSTK
jgi:hypothetical protein